MKYFEETYRYDPKKPINEKMEWRTRLEEMTINKENMKYVMTSSAQVSFVGTGAELIEELSKL
jgi:hypothetical protein